MNIFHKQDTIRHRIIHALLAKLFNFFPKPKTFFVKNRYFQKYYLLFLPYNIIIEVVTNLLCIMYYTQLP